MKIFYQASLPSSLCSEFRKIIESPVRASWASLNVSSLKDMVVSMAVRMFGRDSASYYFLHPQGEDDEIFLCGNLLTGTTTYEYSSQTLMLFKQMLLSLDSNAIIEVEE